MTGRGRPQFSRSISDGKTFEAVEHSGPIKSIRDESRDEAGPMERVGGQPGSGGRQPPI